MWDGSGVSIQDRSLSGKTALWVKKGVTIWLKSKLNLAFLAGTLLQVSMQWCYL